MNPGGPLKLKSKCCKKFKKKGSACGRCPVMAGLGKKTRKRILGK